MSRRSGGFTRARARAGRVQLVLTMLFVALTVTLAVGAEAAVAPHHSLPPVPRLVLSPAAVARERALGTAGAAVQRARERYRRSARGRRARRRSRSAFGHRSAAGALAVDDHVFGPYMRASAYRAPILRGSSIRRWLSSTSVVVGSKSGRQGLMQGTVPLMGLTPAGKQAPLNLSVREHGAQLLPDSGLGGFQLPVLASGQADLKAAGIGVRLAGASDAPAQLVSGKALYANVSTDSDLLLSLAPAGIEISVVLRSPASHRDLPLQFSLPAGDELRATGSLDLPAQPAGGAAIVNAAGQRVAYVTPAVAIDALGAQWPVTAQLQGTDRLVLHVGGGKNVAYPVMVDPTVGVGDPYGQSASESWSDGTWTSLTYYSPSTWSGFHFGTQNNALNVFAFNGSYQAWSTWGDFYRNAAPGAYIYDVSFFNASNIPYVDPGSGQPVSEMYEGIYDAVDGRWSDGGWSDSSNGTSLTAGNGQQGAVRNVYGTTYGDVATVCAYENYYGCSIQAPIPQGSPTTPNNSAVFGLNFNRNYYIPPNTLSQGAVGDVETFSTDSQTPTLSVSHSNPPSGWVSSYSDTVTMNSTLPGGLGMGTQTVSSPGLVATTNSAGQASPSVTVPCSGQASNTCPLTQNSSVTYNLSQAPEGTDTVTASATDLRATTTQTKTTIGPSTSTAPHRRWLRRLVLSWTRPRAP